MSENTLTVTVPRENGIAHWIKQLDRLLRGEATRLSSLRQGIIDVSAEGMMIMILALGALYGLCMGSYALFQQKGIMWPQTLATIGKVPLLFLLTIVVTFPSLYVFNALVGSRLSLMAVFRLIVATVAVMLAILASFGPIVAFFSVSTTSYPFMLLLNVVVFAVSGFLGLKFLLLTLHRLTIAQSLPAEAPKAADTPIAPTTNASPETTIKQSIAQAKSLQPGATPHNAAVQGSTTPQPIPDWNQPIPNKAPVPVVPTKQVSQPIGALDREENQVLGRGVLTVFYTWIIVFGLVGAQMSWVLRPFLGSPDKAFALFRGRESNFFEAVGHILLKMLGG